MLDAELRPQGPAALHQMPAIDRASHYSQTPAAGGVAEKQRFSETKLYLTGPIPSKQRASLASLWSPRNRRLWKKI